MTNERFGIKKYLKHYWKSITFYIIFTLIASFCTVANTLAFAEVIEFITLEKYQEAIKLGFVIIGIIVTEKACWNMVHYIYMKCSTAIMSGMNLELAEQVFKLDSKTFKNHDTGTFVQRIVSDPEKVVDRLSGIVDSVATMLTSAVMLIYIMTLNIYIGLSLLLILIICMFIEKKRGKLRRKNRSAMHKDYDSIDSLTHEIVRSEKDIKSLGLESRLSSVSKESYGRYKKSSYKLSRVDYWFWFVRSTIVGVGTALTLILGIALMEKALISLATFMIVYSSRNSLHEVVWSFGNIFNNIIDIRVSMSRMYSLFDENEFTTEKFGRVHLDKVIGNIEFKNVDFTYRDYEFIKNDDKKNRLNKQSKLKVQKKLVSKTKMFKNLSFKINQNQTVAFVGRSGSGKSTILNLMSKMDVVDKGEVLIDGKNINKLDKSTLRGAISLVNQFPYIFDMSIRDNLLLANQDASDDDIWEVLQKASLYDFVKSLNNGLDTKVGESGIKLSGGQKQRLAIARALLRNSPIIIFDESTSSLDNFAQEDIKKTIDRLKGRSTIVIVAHRLSTIRNVDKIFFLDNGKIVDEGTFEELFDKNDLFRSMFLTEEKV